MFASLTDDIKNAFDHGNMVTRLIMINAGVFVITALMSAFLPQFYGQHVLPWLALPGDLSVLMYRPWTLLTHMFLHQGLWHIIWNMLNFYWFGNITGDLLGDKRIWPVYLFGGLFGALFYLGAFAFLPHTGSMALGASAAVLAIVFTAVATAPEYRIHLILLGPVRIKFIGLFILFVDILGTQSVGNSGGHFAHIGGSLFGFAFVYFLRSGRDLSAWPSLRLKGKQKGKPMSKLKVAHKSSVLRKSNPSPSPSRVDDILDKIKLKGYDSLTDEEKEILYKASKET